MVSNEHVTPSLPNVPPLETFLPLTPTHASVSDSSISDSSIADPLTEMLEEAVDQVCAPLIGTVPRAHRLAKRAALRAELDTLVIAHRELETTPEQAIASAIAHFQRAHPTSHSTLSFHAASQSIVTPHTTSRATLSPNVEARPAALLALGLLAPLYYAHAWQWTAQLQEALAMSETVMYRYELIGVPLLAGLIVGLTMKKRAVRGTFLACLALATVAVLLPSLCMGLSYAQALPFADSDLYKHLLPDPLAGYSGLVLWPLCSAAGATLGTKLRRRKK